MTAHPKTETEYLTLKAEPNKLIVVDFSATWCGPCKMMEPILDQFAEYYPMAKFIHVDVDLLDTLDDSADVNKLPTFKFYRNGKFVLQFTGANPELLKQNVEANI